MYILRKGILDDIKELGHTTYEIRQKGLLSESTLNALRHGGHVSTRTINDLCTILHCCPGDLFCWVDDVPEPLKQHGNKKRAVKTEDD